MNWKWTSQEHKKKNFVTFPVSQVRIYFLNSKNSGVYFARDIVNQTSKALKDNAKEAQRLCFMCINLEKHVWKKIFTLELICVEKL